MTGRAAGVTGAVILALAAPAAADPAGPTDFRSVVDAVEPPAGGVDVGVVGGDSFLELEVDEGREVVVEGYQGEPYLRVLPDGTVERNRHSPATYLNEDREGGVALPADADAEAEPDWEEVAAGGTYAWHDHRIHWMGSGTPPGEPGDVVQGWTVPLTVDGRPTAVEGRLLWVEPVSPWPWIALGLAAAAVVVAAGRRRAATVAAAGALVGAGLALVVGTGQLADAPAQAPASPVAVALPLVGLLAAATGVVLRRRMPTTAPIAVLAGTAAVLGWGVVRWGGLQLDGLWKPVLPTALPAGVDRAGTAVALGLAVAAAVLVVWSGGVTLSRAPTTGTAPGTPADGTDTSG